ncbi:TetR/AcrR family transcriptional regulator [Microbacterium hominis]|uniref:TetR/AcrR family transcriptional regulator n=1 Tax=Microbacterium hominis TaxID=162426 RepID=A0A7D4TLL5_9MICO|nr:TetR/AcrR family transcriptional regulator [Microbacterium hominis]QKJ18362.1 TetR/AcrR family transcriptional regulator [Microbacterium hominis]
MAARGPYKKGVAKRAEILDTAVEVIERNGYSNATVKELADAVGLSQNGLLHYFGSKDRLFLEILRHRDQQLTVQIGTDPHRIASDYRRRVLDATDALAQAPGLLQLGLRLSVDASEPAHPAHVFFAQRYEASREISADALTELRAHGRVPASLDAERAATLLIAAMEGLQAQWSYDPSLDMTAHIAYLLDALGITAADDQPS